MIEVIQPSVERWDRGVDWIAHLARVAAVSRRADTGDLVIDRNRVEQCYKQKHVGVFEHWPIVLENLPPPSQHGCPKWRRHGNQHYGTLRQCVMSWGGAHLPASIMGYWVAASVEPTDNEETLVTCHFTLSRAAADQLRTYRTYISFVMESQRYCNYDKLGFQFIGDNVSDDWMRLVEEEYCERLDMGQKPETARGCLPMEFATRMVASAPRWKWRYIIDQRAHHSTGRAQSEISGLMRRVEDLL